ATKLSSGQGLHARDPRTVLSAWRRAAGSPDADLDEEAAINVARQVGAGRLLLGGAMGTAGRLILSASLVRVPDGKPVAAATVTGSSDSLLDLVDQLTAQLLAREAGADE